MISSSIESLGRGVWAWIAVLAALSFPDAVEAQRRHDRFATPIAAEAAESPGAGIFIIDEGATARRTLALDGALIGSSLGALGTTLVAGFGCVMATAHGYGSCTTGELLPIVLVGTGIGAAAGLLIGWLIERDPEVEPTTAPQ